MTFEDFDIEVITFEEERAFLDMWGMHDLSADDLADIWLDALSTDEEEGGV